MLEAIDVGSNAVRLKVAQPLPDNSLEPLHEERDPVRPGEGVFTTGRLDQEVVERLLSPLRRYGGSEDGSLHVVVETRRGSGVKVKVESFFPCLYRSRGKGRPGARLEGTRGSRTARVPSLLAQAPSPHMSRSHQRRSKRRAARVMTTRVLADHVRAVEGYEAALPEKDAVHEMRVATRRLRAALRVLRLRKFDRDVKSLQDALGDVRDLQLQVDWVRARDAALYRSRRAQLRKAEQALGPALRRWRSHTLPALLGAAAGDSAAPAARLLKTLRKRLKRLQKRLERARVRPTPRSLHAARISVKQVRYLLDVAREELPKKVIRLESDLKTLQASLGELHDVDARIDFLKGKPALLRDQEEARKRLGKIAAAQLARWHKQHLIDRAGAALR